MSSPNTALKRKQPIGVLPYPSFFYKRSGDPNFNVFTGFLMYPGLCIVLASHLPIDMLISLYAISRDFHAIINQRFTTVILSQARRKAYESRVAFPFRCYAHLCQTDPGARFAHPNPRLASKGMLRKVPSFRWLKFVLYREKVIHEVLAIFAERGCPLPQRCSMAMKRLWFLFDIPDNARRIGYIHNRRHFTDLILHLSMCFLVKLDMLCNDPIATEKRDSVRKMLLSSCDGFTTILKVLKRETWRNPMDALVARIRYGSLTDLIAQNEQVQDVFGVAIGEIAMWKKEYWGASEGQQTQLLLRPDQLIVREAVRRGYRFSKHILSCLRFGYTESGTFKPSEPRHEYADETAVLNFDEGGDTLLDLGTTSRGSNLCFEYWVPSRELEARHEEQSRISQYMKLWMEEQHLTGTA